MALVRWTLDQPGNDSVRSVNALVGETNDGGLNDIRGQHVTAATCARGDRRRDHADRSRRAASEPALERSAFGWKGGIGTSSRMLPRATAAIRSACWCRPNYGGVLTIDGAPVGKDLGRYSLQAHRPAGRRAHGNDDSGDGSCMIVVATDAPLDARDLKRLAARAVFGLARTGRRTATAAATLRSPSRPQRICGRSASTAGRARTAGRGGVAALPGRARGHRRSGLQLAV